MPITEQERIEHMEKFGLNDLDTMPQTIDSSLRKKHSFGTIHMASSCILFQVKELSLIRSS